MAVSEVGTGATGTTTTASLPAGWANGDLAILVVMGRANHASAVAGFTLVGQQDVGGAAPFLSFWRRTLVTGDTTFAITITGALVRCAVVFHDFDASVPVDDYAFATDQTNTSTINAPSVTAAVAGDYLVTAYGTNSTATTGTPPSGATERCDSVAGGGNPPATQVNVEAIAASGATGTRTETLNAARSTDKVMGSLLVKAAVTAQTFNKSVAGTVTPSGAVVKQTAKPLPGSVASAGALLRRLVRAFAGSAATAGALLKRTAKSFTGSSTPTGALTRQANKKTAGSITSAGVLRAQANKQSAGAITPTGALVLLSNPLFSAGSVVDAGRDWDVPYQDVSIVFTGAVSDPAFVVDDPAAGHSIEVNGTPYALTYRSGSGTSTLVLRAPVLIHNGDTVTYSYSRAAGATAGPPGELGETVDAALTNSLTKRVRFVVKDKSGAIVANTDVKLGVAYYNGGDVVAGATGGREWMVLAQKALTTTDAAGALDVEFTATGSVGDTVVIVVFHPDAAPVESFTWPTEVA